MTGKLQSRLRARLEELTDPSAAPDGALNDDARTDEPPAAQLSPRPEGPLDVSEVGTLDGYYSVGPLLLPARADVSTRVDLDAAGKPSDLAITHEGSILRLEVFAAPRSEGTWPHLCSQVVDSLSAQGAEAHVTKGRFGPQVEAVVRTGPQTATRVRVIGVDGPGWLLRATVESQLVADADAETEPPAERDAQAAAVEVPLEGMRDVLEVRDGLPRGPLGEIVLAAVVRRGHAPMPVGAQLPLDVDPRLLGQAAVVDPTAEVAPNRFTELPGLWT